MALDSMQHAINEAQSALGRADTADRPLPLYPHDIETRCFDACITIIQSLIQELESGSFGVIKVAALVEGTELNEPQAIPNRVHPSSPESTPRPVQEEGQRAIEPCDGHAPTSGNGQQDAVTSRHNLRSRSAKTDHKE
jgi:hypothetical protein